MKKLIAAIAAIALIFVIGACSQGPSQAFSGTVTGTVIDTTTGCSGRMADKNGAEYFYNLAELDGSADMDIAEGDTLIIHCEYILETYPMQFGNIKGYEHIPA
jgi:hypothetical protein